MTHALPLTDRSKAMDGAWRLTAAFLGLLVISVCPVLIVDIPAMVDYPNHLARMSVLVRDGTPAANPFYEVVWRFYPNLAMDLVVPPLARLVGVESATKAFLVLSQLLLVSGAVAIELSVKRRMESAGFFALLYLYSWPFAFGFVNFAFALGIALWGIAAWIGLRDRSLIVRGTTHVLIVLALAIGHLFALGLYGLAIGLIELHGTVRARRIDARCAALYATMAAPVVALGLVLSVLGGGVGGTGTMWAVPQKLLMLQSINGYSVPATIVTSLVLGLGAYAAARNGWLRFEGAGRWLATGFALAFLVMPFRLFDTAFVDVRVVTAAAFILPAFTTLRLPRGRVRWAAGAGFAGVALSNLAIAAAVQVAYAAEYRAMIATFGQLKPNARVLVAHGRDAVEPPVDLTEYPIFHAPVLAVHYAGAFVPTFFASPGKQPVLPRADVRHLANGDYGVEPLDRLVRIAAGRPVPGTSPYVADWTRDFDYLYVVGPLAPNPLPGLLVMLGEGQRFNAYRIAK